MQKAGEAYFVMLADGKRRDIKVGLQNEEAFEIVDGRAIPRYSSQKPPTGTFEVIVQ